MSRLPLALLLMSAATPLAAQSPEPSTDPLFQLAQRHRVAAITTRSFRPETFWDAVAPALRSSRLQTEDLGRSAEGRPIRRVSFGRGPVIVLLWSQMHGDESTATMALADILAWMAHPEPDALRDRLATRLTVVMVPMLNPDGAARFRRENAWGVDVNRDARALATPEGRILAGLRDQLRPGFGFNLHDQSPRSRVGPEGPQSAFALLAPAADSARTWTPRRERARRLAAAMALSLQPHVPGRVARYDDTWSARAFGDAMQTAGVSTVLLETGAYPGDREKQWLRSLNVVALLTALSRIAADPEVPGPTAPYDDLPENASVPYDLVIRGGTLHLPGLAPLRADLGFKHTGGVGATGLRLEDVGDLADFAAIDTVDATGLTLEPGPAMLPALPRRGLDPGAPADLVAKRGEVVVWRVGEEGVSGER